MHRDQAADRVRVASPVDRPSYRLVRDQRSLDPDRQRSATFLDEFR